MSGIGAGLGILNKVMSLFNWDRKSRRRNKLAKLRKKELELMGEDWTVSLGSKLADVRMQISKLQRQSEND